MAYRLFSSSYMRNVCLIILALIIFPRGITGQTTSFRAGEEIEYVIRYGLMSGGEATLSLSLDTLGEKKVYHSVLFGQTTGLPDLIYKVRDTYESYFDTVTLSPYRAVRDISEGRYRWYNEIRYDRISRIDSVIIRSKRSGDHITRRDIYDIISCFYLFRENFLARGDTLQTGDVITIYTWFADEYYPIILKYKGEEEIRTRLGKINCLAFNPVTEVGRVFKTEDDMTVWFSNDENYLPVKIRFDIFVGKVLVDLVDFRGLATPIIFNN